MKRIGWRSVLVFACVVFLIWMEEGYYLFSATIALRPGVSSRAVKAILGEPYIDAGSSLLYQKTGVGTMLWIHFAGRAGDGEICDWFVLDGPWSETRDEYRVKRYTFYSPGGLLPGPADLETIAVPIYRVDINGNPYPGTAPLQ
jgi:hypothetical protein